MKRIYFIASKQAEGDKDTESLEKSTNVFLSRFLTASRTPVHLNSGVTKGLLLSIGLKKPCVFSRWKPSELVSFWHILFLCLLYRSICWDGASSMWDSEWLKKAIYSGHAEWSWNEFDWKPLKVWPLLVHHPMLFLTVRLYVVKIENMKIEN
jgi:hypothetical protein